MMDIEEWEVLSDDGFLEILDDDAGNKIYSRRFSNSPKKYGNDFQMNNYFSISPKPSSPRFHLDDDLDHDQITKLPIELGLVLPKSATVITTTADDDEALSGNQDGVSQVFFKKENEFVDMKLDSPRSTVKGPTPVDANSFCYEEKNEDTMDLDVMKDDDEDEGGVGRLKFWRWGLNGVGAICSFGVAAATICIIVFTSQQKNKDQHNLKKLRFQIYAHDKRIKQVVEHATKLNEAISMARGMPLTRAHFTVGGYYDGL